LIRRILDYRSHISEWNGPHSCVSETVWSRPIRGVDDNLNYFIAANVQFVTVDYPSVVERLVGIDVQHAISVYEWHRH
jgi:hypothetical protein